jgi:hypothetical protein
MSSTLESKPFFTARARAVGLSDADIKSLEQAGVTTLAGMAFFCAYQPGTSDDSVLVSATSTALAQDPVPAATMVAMRRIHFESHAMYVADLKSKVMSTEDDTPKRMPNAERATRYLEQKQRLSGLVLEGELECSNSLLDSIMQQFDRDELKYLAISSCTSREQEMSGQKRDPKLALDSEGQLKLKQQPNDARADVSSDMKIKNALTRRGLGYDQAGLISFSTHARWIERIFSVMNRAAPDGYSQITVHQILESDKELWHRITDECRTTIIPVPGLPRPLDLAIEKWMYSPEVSYYLMPMPSRSSSSSTTTVPKKEVIDTITKPKGKGRGGKGRGGKGRGGKTSSPSTQMPAGCTNKTSDGRNLCFAYNSPVGCSYAKPGNACKRGVHICAKPGCGGRHSAVSCKPAGA